MFFKKMWEDTMRGLKIGDLFLEHGLMLAPMAGYTDRAMRLIAKKHGAEYLVSEMVSARAIVYNDKKTATLAKIEEDELPCALQLFGSEPEVVAEAAYRVASGEFGGALPPVIDINMGCPVPKVYKNGEGSALMKDPRKIEAICAAVTGKISLPLTVKLRLGVDREHINLVDCALAAEAGGANALALINTLLGMRIDIKTKRPILHNNVGGLSGPAVVPVAVRMVWQVRNAVDLPILGMGGIASAEDAIEMLIAGADAVGVGTAMFPNPYLPMEIIDGIADYMEKNGIKNVADISATVQPW